jgi:adenosine deaminase
MEIPLELIQRLPKTGLHCHLDGSLRLDTVLDLAKKQHVKLPTFDRGELYNLLYAGEHVASLDDYLRAFDITLSVMQTEEGLDVGLVDGNDLFNGQHVGSPRG